MIYYESLIAWTADSILLIALCSSFMTLRDHMKKVIIAFIIICASLLEYWLKITLNVKSVIAAALIFLIIVLTLYQDKLLKKMAVISFYLIFTVLLEFVSGFMLESLNNFQMASIYDLVYYSICIFIKLNIILLLKRFYKKRLEADNSLTYSYQISVPLVSIIGFYIIYFRELLYQDIDMVYVLIYVFALSLINIVAYYVFEKNELLNSIYAQQKIENEMYLVREDYYNKLEEYFENMRILKHDYKNQLITIYPYIKEGDVKKEIKTLLQQVSDLDQKYLYTKNEALNAILNEKRSVAEKYNIKSNFEVVFPQNVHISGNEIGRLIGNLLDNAIEALENFNEEKYINLKIIYYNRSISIEIENPVTKKVENLVTYKKHKVEHGIGSKSITKIVEKYNGVYEWYSTNDMFHTSIILWDKDALGV